MMSSSPNALPKSDSHPAPSSQGHPTLSKTQHTLLDLLRTPKEMTYARLCETVQALPQDDRFLQTDLDNALFELVRIGYLSSFFEDGDVVYMLQTVGSTPPSKRDEQVLWNPLDVGLEGISLRRSSSPHATGINRFMVPGLNAAEETPPAQPAPEVTGVQRFNFSADLLNSLQIELPQQTSKPSRRRLDLSAHRRGTGLNRARVGHRRHCRTHHSLSQRARA